MGTEYFMVPVVGSAASFWLSGLWPQLIKLYFAMLKNCRCHGKKLHSPSRKLQALCGETVHFVAEIFAMRKMLESTL
jgi:hypothetical protein